MTYLVTDGRERIGITYKVKGSLFKRKTPYPKKSLMGVEIIHRVVNKVHARKMETKTSTSSVSDGIEIFHNNFVVLDPTSNFLRTTVGASDSMTFTVFIEG
jgi:hypothetical protein